MDTGITVIIGMAVTTVSSSILQKMLNSTGRMDESQLVDFTSKCILGIIALTYFAKFLKTIGILS